MKRRIAVVLFNLGGPDSKESIRPFLRNLFSDKAIIDLPAVFRIPIALLISTFRAPKAKPLYDLMGGSSPLLPNTKAQAAAIEALLSERNKDIDFKVFIAMRYWHPFTKAAAKDVLVFNPDEVVLLPLYPQYSLTTTGSSYLEWRQYYKGKDRLIREYPTAKGLVDAAVENILKTYNELDCPKKVRLLLSAHGLPQKIIDGGDPYEKQINETAEAIKAKLPEFFEVCVCYQSKVGPLKWLSPSTNDAINDAGRDNIGVIIYPIAFVSEHIETLVELDVEYRELAHEAKVPFFGRALTVGTNDSFIKELALLVEKEVGVNVV